MARTAWKAYCCALASQPLATQALTAAAGFSLGDASAQILGGPAPRRLKGRLSGARSEERYSHDWARTARTAAFGGIIAGPMGHSWFTFLERAVMPSAPRSLPAVGLKMAMDQTLMAPFGCMLYFACMDLLTGQPDAVIPSLHSKFRKTLLASYKLWPAAHVINFAFVPPQYRVLYTNLVSVVWTSILSQNSVGTEEPAVTMAASGVAGQAVPAHEGGDDGIGSAGTHAVPLLDAEAAAVKGSDIGSLSAAVSAPQSSSARWQLRGDA